jgi:hypothetical protein
VAAKAVAHPGDLLRVATLLAAAAVVVTAVSRAARAATAAAKAVAHPGDLLRVATLLAAAVVVVVTAVSRAVRAATAARSKVAAASSTRYCYRCFLCGFRSTSEHSDSKRRMVIWSCEWPLYMVHFDMCYRFNWALATQRNSEPAWNLS